MYEFLKIFPLQYLTASISRYFMEFSASFPLIYYRRFMLD